MLGIGTGIGIAADIFLNPSVCSAAEIGPLDRFACGDEERPCLCRDVTFTKLVPSWWAIVLDLHNLENEFAQLRSPEENYGEMHPRDCEQLNGAVLDVKTESVRGFTIYTITTMECSPGESQNDQRFNATTL